jgi:hypothetical protein
MSDDQTARLALPYLHAGQAQKDETHNEALALLDIAVQAAVLGAGVNAPPADPAAGACWIVGAAPTGAWAGQANAIAGWTGDDWRFVAPRAGMTAWNLAAQHAMTHDGSGWQGGVLRASRLLVDGVAVVGPRAPAIPDPAGGTSVDGAARATLSAVLAALRSHGLIGS